MCSLVKFDEENNLCPTSLVTAPRSLSSLSILVLPFSSLNRLVYCIHVAFIPIQKSYPFSLRILGTALNGGFINALINVLAFASFFFSIDPSRRHL